MSDNIEAIVEALSRATSIGGFDEMIQRMDRQASTMQKLTERIVERTAKYKWFLAQLGRISDEDSVRRNAASNQLSFDF